MKEMAKLEKECRSAEAASSNIVSGSLDDELIVELEQSAAHVRNAARGFVDKVNHGKSCQWIHTNDPDF